MAKKAKVPSMSAQAAGNKRRDRSRSRAIRQEAKLVSLGKMLPRGMEIKDLTIRREA